jgi:hypothetical protein
MLPTVVAIGPTAWLEEDPVLIACAWAVRVEVPENAATSKLAKRFTPAMVTVSFAQIVGFIT